MFSGRGKRNRNIGWNEVIKADANSSSYDNSDGGAPLHTPVNAAFDDGNHHSPINTAKHQAPIEIVSDTSFVDGSFKIIDGPDDRGPGLMAQLRPNGASLDHCKNNDSSSATAMYHSRGDHKGKSRFTATKSQLSPLAASFTPQSTVVTAGASAPNIDEGGLSQGTIDLMAMIAKNHPHLFNGLNETDTGGQLPHSSTSNNGFTDSPVENVSSLYRASQAGQPTMTGSISLNSMLDGQGQTGKILRASHTAPTICDPLSVAAVLGDDSGYDSTASGTGTCLSSRGDNDLASIEARRNVLLADLQRGKEALAALSRLSTIKHKLSNNADTIASPSTNTDAQIVQQPYLGPGKITPAGLRATNRGQFQRPGPYRITSSTILTPARPMNNTILSPVFEANHIPADGPFTTNHNSTQNQRSLQLSRHLEVPTEKLFECPTPQQIMSRSCQLNAIVGPNGIPNLNVLLNPSTVPFVENYSLFVRRKNHGVLKIRNCPFNVPRAELIAIFGRAARLLSDTEEAVHIILEKVSAKTQDSYIEFQTQEDATKAYQRIQDNIARGRPPRIGSRQVSIEISNQAALMEDLFPVAHGVTWIGGADPTIQTNSPYPMENFKCFISEEECSQMVRHFECPGRSPFSRDCPERFIESMISTLKKLPWHMSEHITLYQQYYIFDACQRLLEQLLEELDPEIQTVKQEKYKRPGHERLTTLLLERFKRAILLCPGFTVVQKDGVAHMLGLSENETRQYNLPRQAHSWNHLYVLCPRPGVPVDVLEYYISIIRLESNREINRMPIQVKQRLIALAEDTDTTLFGNFFHDINYPYGESMDHMTLAGAARLEWSAIDRVIQRALHYGPDENIPAEHFNTVPQIDNPPCASLLTDERINH